MKSFKMTALAAAAVASMGLAGQAHALTNSGSGTSGSLFLYVFEDRGDNPAATNTAIFDLGLVSGFDTTANFSLDLSADSAWTTFVDTMTAANVHWGVFGAIGTGTVGSQMFTTATATPTIGGAALNTAIVNSNFEIHPTTGVYAGCGSSCGFNAVTTNDLATAKWDDNAGYPAGIPTMTGNFGDQLNFYKWTSNGTKASVAASRTDFAFGGDADYWTLGSDGQLNYVASAVAPVPEADTYALLLAGLGMVGFMARRRKQGLGLA